MSGNRGKMLHLILTIIQKVEKAFARIVDGGEGGGERILEVRMGSVAAAVGRALGGEGGGQGAAAGGACFVHCARRTGMQQAEAHVCMLHVCTARAQPTRVAPHCLPARPPGQVFDVKLKESIYKLPFDKILTLKNVRHTINEADGYQPHIIAPEAGYRCAPRPPGPAPAAPCKRLTPPPPPLDPLPPPLCGSPRLQPDVTPPYPPQAPG